MGFILSVIFLLFIAPIGLGLTLIFRSNKKAGFLILSIPLIVIVLIVGWWTYEVNHHFVKSTALINENVEEITLYAHLDSDFQEKYGSYEIVENVFYNESLKFQQLVIGTNEKKEIIFISCEKPEMSTTKNIHVGNSFDEVIDKYGGNYYIYRDMGMDDSINFVDRESRVHLQFYYRDDQITKIVLQEM